jgi:O-antigen/teichoic acid export membrane protein
MLYRLSMGASWFTVMNMVDLAKFTITPALLTLYVLVFQWKLPGAVYALISREVLLFLFIVLLILRHTKPAWRIRGGFIREGAGYGLRAWVGDMTAKAYARLDHFLLGSIAADSVYTLYNIAAKVTELLWLPANALGPVLFNRIAKVRDQMQRIILTEQIHRVVFLTIVIGGLFLGAIIPWFIPLVFGSENASAVWPALLLIPGTLAVVTQKVLTKYFGGSGQPGKSSITTVVGTGVIGVLSATLIPVLQSSGAAVASAMGYVAMSLTAYLIYRRMIKPRKPQLFNIRLDDARWAYDHVREAFGVWREKLGRNGIPQ